MPETFTDPTTGLPVVADGGKVVLRDAQGFVSVPADLAGQYIAQQGFVPATPEEVAARAAAREQEGFVGGTKAAVKSFATHAFDAATFPVSIAQAGAAALGQDDWVEGLDELRGAKVLENIAGIATELSGGGFQEGARREFREATQAQYAAHPTTTTVAGVAGDVVGGLGLEGLSSSAGKGIASGLAGRVGERAASVLGRAADMGLQGGVLGAAQASQQAYIDDAPITSQKILAGFGLGSALGAGVGAGIGGLSVAGRAVRDKADDLVAAFGKSQRAPVELADQSLDEVAARALGPDTAPAPGLGAKLRDALEQTQAAATGVDREALKKFGPLRWDDEAMKGREMAFRRDEILEGAKAEVTDRTSALIKNADTVMEEVRDMGLKREHVARLLAGVDDATPRGQLLGQIRESGLTGTKYARGGMRDLRSFRDAFEGATADEVDAIAMGKAPTKNRGEAFKPVEVSAYDDGTIALQDGRHRMTAAAEAGAKNMRAKVRRYDAEGELLEEFETTLPIGPSPAGGAQKSAALQQLWGVQDELARIAGATDEFGNRAIVGNAQKLVAKLAKQIEEGDAADAFIGLDSVKRALQKDRVSLGNSAMKQGDAYLAQQAEALGRAFEGMQEKVRQGLMDESVWGQAGKAQRDVNAAWESWFDHKHMFESGFLTPTKKKFGGGWEHAVNPQKVSTYLDRLGRKESALVDKHFRGYLEATERLTKAIGEQYDIGAKAAAVQEVAGASRAVAETMKRADKTVAVANQVQDILQAQGEGTWIASAIGGMAGGPAGAVAGAMIGAVTNPGRQLKMAWGLQNMMGKVDNAIKSHLDGFFTAAKAKLSAPVEKAAEATRQTTRTTRRAMLPAGLAFERFATAGETRRVSYEKRREQIADLIARPARLAQLIEKQVEPVMKLSPGLGQQMALDMARALAAVQDAAPPESSTSALMKRTRRSVSDQDITRFAEAWEGVTSPLTILEDLRRGRISTTKRDAVAAAYPDLFREMQLSALERLNETEAPLPLQERTLLDQFLQLGGAGEPTLRPDFLRRQAERAQMRQQQGQESGPPQRGAPNIAGGAATLTQSLATT
jgi:hypothetical protein